MTDQSGYEHRHDHAYTDLHDAFGAEVADLDIGATPVGAVMRGGTTLRTRRRLTAVSGVAALAVLPVAAVTIFAGAGGGAGAGPGTLQSAARTNSTGHTGSTGHTTPDQAESSAPAITKGLTPSVSIILPQLTPNIGAPNPNDLYTVVASGTIDGKHWRLVRDVFVVSKSQPLMSGLGHHLPIAEKGKANTATCADTGLQWGTNPPGSQPDFDAGGQCGGDVESVRGPLSSGEVAHASGLSLWSLIGRVDSAKVASVSVTIGDHTTARQPISPVPGENDGYYVVLLPALSEQDQQAMKYYTTYDAGGHVVDHVQFG
ncbi:hypothetical protein [Catenulispora rubra]|uniref:hypothetical protein n=1 Tax=Catenulispora rubra TaxID=280293 RepID=UPI001892839A|nr:hypothetical protein [Catenulispora rubra]